MTSWSSQYFWLIPLLPLAASLLILALRQTRSAAAFALAVVGQIAALLLAVGAFISTLPTPGTRLVQNFTWFTFGNQALRIGVVLDPLAAAMLVMITFVGLWIFVFSKGYMAGDKDFTRFFAYLSFFSAALFSIGLLAALSRKHAIFILIGIELMLAAANLNFIAFWRFGPPSQNPTGVMVAIFSIAIAAAEAAVGLALVIAVYRHYRTTNVRRFNRLKG